MQDKIVESNREKYEYITKNIAHVISTNQKHKNHILVYLNIEKIKFTF